MVGPSLAGSASVSLMHLSPNCVSLLVSWSQLRTVDLLKYKRFSYKCFAAETKERFKRFWFQFLPLSPVHVGNATMESITTGVSPL